MLLNFALRALKSSRVAGRLFSKQFLNSKMTARKEGILNAMMGTNKRPTSGLQKSALHRIYEAGGLKKIFENARKNNTTPWERWED